MEKYEWITLDICDPNSEVDMWDLSTIFEDTDLFPYADLIMQSYFPFIIRKQVEEKSPNYNRYAVPIGYIFLEYEKKNSDVLFMNYGLVKNERQKGYMKQSMSILNDKLAGNSEEWADWKREYEKIMNSFLIVNKVKKDDELLNALALKSGNLVMSNYKYNFYEPGYAFSLTYEQIEEDKELIQKENVLILTKNKVAIENI